MTENKRYCMGCMKEIDESVCVCPHCQYNSSAIQHEPCLPKESVIADRYLVGTVTAIANDSITYIGLDTETEEVVFIHEFYPVKIVRRNESKCEVMVKLGCDAIYRNCLQSFIKLWKGIGAIDNQPALPTVRNIIDFNGTVYTICKHLDSITLKSYFEESKNPLTWKGINVAFTTVINALKALHDAGVVHGSISPSSVHVGADKKLHITGFMIPQCRSQVEALKISPVHGFSPVEFYSEEYSAKACSDIYSLMALIYYSITGIVPPKATERAIKDEMIIPSSVASSLPKSAITCIAKSLAVQPENRYQTMNELMNALSITVPSAPTVTSAADLSEKTERKTAETKEKSKKKASAEKKKEKTAGGTNSGSSLFALAFGTFFAVVIICLFVFSLLYTTVLYKNYDIPLLNKAFSSWTFLPMNQVEDVYNEPEISTSEYDKEENTYVTVPDFTVHTYDSITSNETFNKNFKFSFTYEWNDTVPKDGVISQDINKGESVLSGSTIAVVISKGIEQIELPDVIGMNYEDAKKTLEDSLFVVKIKFIDNDGTYEELTVATMDKVAGLEFDKGSEITLTVFDELMTEITTEETSDDESSDDKTDEEETTEESETKNQNAVGSSEDDE